jgi:hypothetical protein
MDQVCIDQMQKVERGHQVQLMGDIYRRADLVIAWIPEVAPILQQVSKPTYNISPKRNDDIQRMFRVKYWNRIWVQQEIILARRLVINSSLDKWTCLMLWEDLVRATADVLPTMHNTQHPKRKGQYYMEHEPPVLKALLEYRSLSRLGIGMHLEEAMYRFQIYECSEPKDQIFGLLGLVRPVEQVRVDYSMSEKQLWDVAFSTILRTYE